MQLWRETEPVVITGIGLITALGTGVEKSWTAMKEGRSGIRRITFFDPTPFPSQIAGEIHDFDPEAFIDPREVRKMDRYVQLAAAATFMALQDAELTITPQNADRVGVCIGSGIGGGVDLGRKPHQLVAERTARRLAPLHPDDDCRHRCRACRYLDWR